MKTRIAGLAAIVAAPLVLGALLPGCSSAPAPPDPPPFDVYSYSASATIVNVPDGTRYVVSRLTTFPFDIPAEVRYFNFRVLSDDAATDDAALRLWKRLLTAVVDPSDGYGSGPWCLLTIAVESDHARLSRTLAGGPGDFSEFLEMPMCPPSAVLAGLEIAPRDVPFEPVGVGFQSAVREITLTNGGGAPLDLAEPVLERTGEWLEFLLDRGTCALVAPADHLTLAPGGACSFYVTFQPTAGGERSADVRIASAEFPDATLAVHLSGEGLPGTLAVDRNFCVPRDTDGCFRRDLQLLNLGPGRLTIESFAGSGDWTLGNWRPHAPPIADIDPSAAAFVTVSSCVPAPAPTTLSVGFGPGEAPIGVNVVATPACTP